MGRNRIKTVTAGRLVYAVCYSQPLLSDLPEERAAKSKISTAARKRLNFRAAWQKLELVMAANFTRRDYWVTLSYDDAHLPPDRDAARACIKRYFRRLRPQYARRGLTMKYLYNVESVPDAPDEARRLHHHLIITASDPELIRSLWDGGQVDVEPLLDGTYDSYEARARYMVKERHPEVTERKLCAGAWTPSLNLDKPAVSSELVPDSVTITAPPGAYILEQHGDANYWGCYTYIKYLLPEPSRSQRRRP